LSSCYSFLLNVRIDLLLLFYLKEHSYGAMQKQSELFEAEPWLDNLPGKCCTGT
jgi:hypothetical protein